MTWPWRGRDGPLLYYDSVWRVLGVAYSIFGGIILLAYGNGWRNGSRLLLCVAALYSVAARKRVRYYLSVNAYSANGNLLISRLTNVFVILKLAVASTASSVAGSHSVA